ncbi:MAG: HAD family phosphatase [Mucilaginibacter polytrichastri]|nr:HAD family phosphatase [Mucilaginibacter polytrichastri]
MTTIRNIIFDYGNVIFRIDFKRVAQAFADLGIADPESFFSATQQSELFDSLDKGLITPDEFRAGVREATGKAALTDEEIDEAWNSILVGVERETYDMLLKAKEKYRTFLLSNTNAIHYIRFSKYMVDEFGSDNSALFEKDYYSHLMGKRKPNADIFEQVLSENNLKPEETLFIDDNRQNIEAAAALGIQTHLLAEPETVVAYFEKAKLL